MYLSGKSKYIRSIVYQRGKVCNSRGSTLSWRSAASPDLVSALPSAVVLVRPRTFYTSFRKPLDFKT